MGFFDFLKSKTEYTAIQVAAKCMAGIRAYQSKDFERAATLFSEYFEMKGFGKFQNWTKMIGECVLI